MVEFESGWIEEVVEIECGWIEEVVELNILRLRYLRTLSEGFAMMSLRMNRCKLQSYRSVGSGFDNFSFVRTWIFLSQSPFSLVFFRVTSRFEQSMGLIKLPVYIQTEYSAPCVLLQTPSYPPGVTACQPKHV